MTLEIHVLGPVRACADGVELSLGGSKQRALLACLAHGRGRPLSADQLIDDLWGNASPRDPAHALQARISRLRAAVPVAIELTDGGYRLDPKSTRVDADEFEEFCSVGLHEHAQGNEGAAARHLRAALELWSGHPFSGIPAVASLHAESIRLDALHASAQTERIEIDIARGRHNAVIPELRALIEANPLAERHWHQLMLALHRDGRHHEALDVFARARETFAEHLGVEPTDQMRRLHLMILHATSAPPVSEANQRSAPAGAAMPDLAQRLATATVSSNQAHSINLLLRTHGALLLTGPAGIGKTHLLRTIESDRAARGNSPRFLTASPLSRNVPLGVFAGHRDLPADIRSSPGALVDHFARHRSETVLLVDNVDDLDEASLYVITHLIRTSRVSAILAGRTLMDTPPEIRALYDSGDLVETPVDRLSDVEAHEVIVGMLGSEPTPDSAPQLIEAAEGNPFHLREIVSGSIASGGLVSTDRGWQLREPPTPTPRLAQVIGAALGDVGEHRLTIAALVAIAGEIPMSCLNDDDRRALTRIGILAAPEKGWVRLSRQLMVGAVRLRLSEAEWYDATQQAIDVLLSDAACSRSEARRRGLILALENGHPIDVDDAISLAQHALGGFDERLALRAAEYAIMRDPSRVEGHRLAALAASALDRDRDADKHFQRARERATTVKEMSSVAIAHAEHLGIQLYDAVAALSVINEARATLSDADDASALNRAAMRWATVAGMSAHAATAQAESATADVALGLITVGMSCVITGPLRDVSRPLSQLREIPAAEIARVPGGDQLVELTKTMALSNTGDVIATRHLLERRRAQSEDDSPETLGIWEYALGFTELLSGDASRAGTLAEQAVTHLSWKDSAGLLPAAHALAGAAAEATGRSDDADAAFGAVPSAAVNDPKVVMLSAWREARRLHTEGEFDRTAETLTSAARWMLDAQHTFFAGMLAHCAMRTGFRCNDAFAVIDEARLRAGGGLLEMFMRHGHAALSEDTEALATVANDAAELGMASTAVDTRLVAGHPCDPSDFVSGCDNASLTLWSPLARTRSPMRRRA